MVNAIVLVIFLIVIVIVGVFALNLGNQLVDATQQAQEQFFTFVELQEVVPIPTVSEDVCDLKVTVSGELTETLPFTELFVKLDFSDIRYEWFDCHPSTGIPFFSLLDIGKNNVEAFPLAFSFGGEVITSQIVLKNFPNDQTVKIDALTRPNLIKTTLLPQGVFPTPFDLTKDFIITNIPDRNYKLEVFYGREINNMGQGEPFVTNICKQFTTSC